MDTRKEDNTEYWLKHIKSFGGDSPVLIAINKIDENSIFDLNLGFLQKKYPNIRGFYRLSCKSGQGIKSFKKVLLEQAAVLEMPLTKWAQKWFDVKECFEDMNEPFIDYETCQKICTRKGVYDSKQQTTLLEFLNDLGIVVYFRDFDLADTHVLDPKWITNAIYKIINSGRIKKNKGVLNLTWTKQILEPIDDNGFKYPRAKHRYIIELMKKFEICYPINSEHILIPDLLPKHEPEYNFNNENVLNFIIDYDFLPPTVIPRFIVRMHADILNELRWFTGVVLQNRVFLSTAVIKADKEERRIYVAVCGDQKTDYFAIILNTLREINSSFEKLEFTEKVPMPDNPSITVSYSHLLRLERKGHETYLPDGSEKEYRVKDLLGRLFASRETEKDILVILHDLQERIPDEKTFTDTANKIITMNPNFMGMGININELIRQFIRRKDKQK